MKPEGRDPKTNIRVETQVEKMAREFLEPIPDFF